MWRLCSLSKHSTVAGTGLPTDHEDSLCKGVKEAMVRRTGLNFLSSFLPMTPPVLPPSLLPNALYLIKLICFCVLKEILSERECGSRGITEMELLKKYFAN